MAKRLSWTWTALAGLASAGLATGSLFAAPPEPLPADQLDWQPWGDARPADALCRGRYVMPAYRLPPPPDANVISESDRANYGQDGETTLGGEVLLRRGDAQLEAPRVRVPGNRDMAYAAGPLTLRDSGLLVRGEAAALSLTSDAASIDTAHYVAHEQRLRGDAVRLARLEDGRYRLTEASFTTCEPGNNLWRLVGSDILLDRERGVGTATHARLEMGKVPVFYWPWVRFPLDERRQTGVLWPIMGLSSDSLDYAQPFYWNIAPNHDATLTPRWMSDRGLLLGAEYRYLFKQNAGQIEGAYIADDRMAGDEAPDASALENGDARWYLDYRHAGRVDARTRYRLRYGAASDGRYFDDFGRFIGDGDTGSMPRLAQLDHRGDVWQLQARAQGYQKLDDPLRERDKPFYRLPSLTANARWSQDGGYYQQWRSNLTYFWRDVDETLVPAREAANGTRLHLSPAIGWRLDERWGHLEPRIEWLATAYQLAEHGEKFPNTAIKQRFNQAEGVLDSNIADGRHIMEAVYFLTETGKVTPEVEDIAKSCLSETGKYYDVKSDYAKGIEKLEKHNLLIKKEGYSIATELEEQLISEMEQEDVGVENRKRILADQVNETGLFAGFQSVKVEGQYYQVKAVDSSGNLLAGKSESELRLKILNLYEIGAMDYQEAIEDTKYQEEANENTLTIIPRVKDFHKIDTLIQKIYRYEIIKSRYGNDSDKEKRDIVEDMQDDRRNKEEVLRQKLKKAYQNGVLIRDFEEYQLSESNFGIIEDQMEELAKNLYTKRLSNHLDENIAPKILKQENPERLGDHFEAEEFKFFDSGGNFIGEGLPTVDEITRRTSDIAVDGKALEDEFSAPPYGWELGDIMVTLAALLRAGQLKVKYKGEEILDYRKSSVHSVFNKSRSFRKAQFKVTSVKLSPNKKRQLVDSIKEINGKKYSDSDLDHNSADIHVVKQIPQIAGGYLEEARSLGRTLGDFADEVPELSSIKNQLNTYHNRTVNEDTYKQVANEFLEDAEQISTYIDLLRELQNFQEKKLGKLRRYRSFVKDLESQMSKVEDEKLQSSLRKSIENFNQQNDDPVNNFPELQESFQGAKDFYHEAMSSSHQGMTEEYWNLVNDLEEVLSEAKEAGENANRSLINDLQSQIVDAKSYVCDELSITDSVKCDNCQNDLKTAVLATDNISNLENKLFSFREKIEKPEDDENGVEEVETHSVTISQKGMTVSEFRDFLSTQLERVKKMDPDDEIEIDFNI